MTRILYFVYRISPGNFSVYWSAFGGFVVYLNRSLRSGRDDKKTVSVSVHSWQNTYNLKVYDVILSLNISYYLYIN